MEAELLVEIKTIYYCIGEISDYTKDNRIEKVLAYATEGQNLNTTEPCKTEIGTPTQKGHSPARSQGRNHKNTEQETSQAMEYNSNPINPCQLLLVIQ